MIPPEILKIGNLLESQDAVAEVMDFITILGILVLSISIIGVAGYPVLKNAQEARYVENTRLSFILMAENLNKVALGRAPSKSVELKMYGGRLSVSMDSTIKINATNSSNKEITLFDSTFGNIENSIGDTVVAYEGTGVWVKYPSGAVLNDYKPLFSNQSNTLIIPVIQITGNSSMGGNGLSRIRAEGEPRVLIYNNVSNITVTIKGNYVSGWKDYFEKMNEMDWVTNSSTGRNYTAELNSTRNLDVYILNTEIYAETE